MANKILRASTAAMRPVAPARQVSPQAAPARSTRAPASDPWAGLTPDPESDDVADIVSRYVFEDKNF